MLALEPNQATLALKEIQNQPRVQRELEEARFSNLRHPDFSGVFYD